MDALKRFQDLLRGLFQFDMAELDFGLYRLLRLKRDEIEAFITEQLPRQVDEAFSAAADEESADLQTQVEALADQIRDNVADDAVTADYRIKDEYRDIEAKIVRELVDKFETTCKRLQSVQAVETDKAEIFNHLYSFFSRYYEDGDFIPKRRYGAREAYAVPYDGSEVFFHWANRDQHYVKTSETFKDYAFSVEGDLISGGDWRVRFVITEATVPKDNVKGDRRFFFPVPNHVEYDASARECRVPFEYRPPTEEEIRDFRKTEKQKLPDQRRILKGLLPGILETIPDDNLQAALSGDQRMAEEISNEKPPLPLLLKRMLHFARRNTTDYFIHKNLRRFLLDEFQFYIKDQVLHIEDLEGDFEARRRTIRVLRRLGEQVIDFLSQIEDVQKCLFEKKKFVLETSYLIPIQHIPRDFWQDVLNNSAQISQWNDWFALNPKKDLFNQKGEVNETFLKEHPTLVVDTKLFDSEWTIRLLEALPFDDLDDATDGLMVHSENYQALNLLLERYREHVKCIYIDPPYNTGKDGFIYKDRYQHSTWLAMILERILSSYKLLQENAVLFSSIDRNEIARLHILLNDVINSPSSLGEIVWHNARDNNPTQIAIEHEYLICIGKGKEIRSKPWKSPFSDATELLQGLYMECKSQGLQPNEIQREVRKFIKDNKGLLGEIDRYKFVDANGIYTGSESVHNPHPGGYDYEIIHPTTGKPMRKPVNAYRFPESTMREKFIEKNRLIYGPDEKRIVKIKLYLEDYLDSLRSVITLDGRLGAYSIRDLFAQDESLFSNPKPVQLIQRILGFIEEENAVILDYFAGSGTTAHCVFNLNRFTRRSLKIILIEVDKYFDTVMLPRVAKIMYTPEWKDGKPKRLATAEEARRTPRMVKILRLESYEDALHNLASPSTQQRVKTREKAFKDITGEDEYRLRYLVKLSLEASETMLDLKSLEHPFNYTLEVLTEEGPRRKPVDLIETFNYLYGLRVRRLETWKNDQDKIKMAGGSKKQPREYRIIKATDREQKRHVLVVWRDTTALNPQTERDFLEAKVKEMAQAGEAFDEQLINADTVAERFASLDPLFKHLMMAGEEESP